MRRSIALGLTLALVPALAQSQTCLGLPSFSRVPAHLSATASSGDVLTHLGGRLAWAPAAAGLFASVEGALVDIDGVNESAFSVGGTIGFQPSPSKPNAATRARPARPASRPARPRTSKQPASNAPSMQWCPLASVEYQSGPNFDVLGQSFDLSALTIGAGASLGMPIVAGTNWQLIPTGGLALAYTKVSADAGAFGSGSESETYGIVSLGVGFLMNQTISLKPFVGIPVGLEGSDPRLGIMASFGLGQRSRVE
jgi:hypothetical protein